VTSSARQIALAVNGAPLCFRQVAQWHSPTLTGSPRASIRTAPQLHDAVLIRHSSFSCGDPTFVNALVNGTVAPY
jgi:hypothetical protein